MSHHKPFIPLSFLFLIQIPIQPRLLCKSLIKLITLFSNIFDMFLKMVYVLSLYRCSLCMIPLHFFEGGFAQGAIHHIKFILLCHRSHPIEHTQPWVPISGINSNRFGFLVEKGGKRSCELYWFCMLYVGFIHCIFTVFVLSWFSCQWCEFTFFHLPKKFIFFLSIIPNSKKWLFIDWTSIKQDQTQKFS